METPIKMDDLGVPIFLETSKWISQRGWRYHTLWLWYKVDHFLSWKSYLSMDHWPLGKAWRYHSSYVYWCSPENYCNILNPKKHPNWSPRTIMAFGAGGWMIQLFDSNVGSGRPGRNIGKVHWCRVVVARHWWTRPTQGAEVVGPPSLGWTVDLGIRLRWAMFKLDFMLVELVWTPDATQTPAQLLVQRVPYWCPLPSIPFPHSQH